MSLEWEAGRLDSDLEGVGFDTLAVRAGQHRTPEGEHGEASGTVQRSRAPSKLIEAKCSSTSSGVMP